MDPDSWGDTSGVMVSNLPLLFAHGLPTSLQEMTLKELEIFVQFMVRCSVGVELTVAWSQLPRPPWWPGRLPFRLPYSSNSARTLFVRLVERCYAYHGCQYLLQFCARLLQMQPPSGYRFTDNRDGTTSMYHGATCKLLVTFRNENRDYDKTAIPKSTSSQRKLLPIYPNHGTHGGGAMVRPPTTDVYLCDHCDEEFTSLKEVQVHEKYCKGDRPISPKVSSPEPEPEEEIQEPEDEQVPFLSYLRLRPAEHTGVEPYLSPRKRPATPAKRAVVTNYLRFETVPFSSPLGRFILSKCKYGGRLQITQHQIMKYEKYIYNANDDVISTRERSSNRWVVIWRPRKDQQPWSHSYSFTKIQSNERLMTIERGLNKRSRYLYSQCRGVKVKLKRLSKSFIERHTKQDSFVIFIPCIDLTSSEEPTSDPLATPEPHMATLTPEAGRLEESLRSPSSSLPTIPRVMPNCVAKPLENGSNDIPSLAESRKKQLSTLSNYGVTVSPVFSIESSEEKKKNSFLTTELRVIRYDSRSNKPGQGLDIKANTEYKPLSVPNTCTKLYNSLKQQQRSNKKEFESVEVIDISSDGDDDSTSLSQNNYHSKNGYSHWSSKESSLSGRSIMDSTANGVPPSIIPPPSNHSGSFVSSAKSQHESWAMGQINFPAGHFYSDIKKEGAGVSDPEFPGITLDDEISFKSPLQIDDDISFTYQHEVPESPNFPSNIPYMNNSISPTYFHRKIDYCMPTIPVIKKPKLEKTSTPKPVLELRRLMNDECRELRRKGLHTLQNNDLTSKKRVTRFSLQATSNTLNTRRKKYISLPRIIASKKSYPKEKKRMRTFETISKTKPLLQDSSYTYVDENCNTPLTKLSPELETNNNEPKIVSEDYVAVKEEPKSPIYKKIRKNLSNKKRRGGGLLREISQLLKDECKEIKDMGFHPTHILGTAYHDFYPIDEIDKITSPNKAKNLLLHSKKLSPKKLSSGQLLSNEYSDTAIGGENGDQMLHRNKKLKLELSKLMQDEWKELREAGHHPSQTLDMSSNESFEEDISEVDNKKCFVMINSDYSLMRSTRRQAKMLSYVQLETPRSAHRSLLASATGMCIVNYQLPDVL